MISKELEKKIVYKAFLKEIEKSASLKTTAAKYLGKFFLGASKLAPKKGAFISGNTKTFFETAGKRFAGTAGKSAKSGISDYKSGMAFLKSHMDPAYRKGKFGVKILGKGTKEGTQEALGSSFITRSIGKTVGHLGTLTHGVSNKKTVLKNIKQVTKNISEDIKNQITHSKYRVFDPKAYQGKVQTRTTILGKQQDYIKTNWGFKRDVISKTRDGRVITKKRLPATISSLAFTPVGMGATAAISDHQKDEEGNKKRNSLLDGAKEYAKWITPIGATQMNAEMIESAFGD
jgi:hypothetical protein